MNEIDDKAFIAAIRTRLDASLDSLDPALVQRLDSVRREALQVSPAPGADGDEDLLERVRVALDDSSELPPRVESQLDQVRQRAMARLQESRSVARDSLGERLAAKLRELATSRPALPATAFASVFVMVTAVSLFYLSSRPGGSLSVEDELVLIASAEELELYENLDFYLWLADNGIPD